MSMNDPRFLDPMGERLHRLGLDVKDVGGGQYIRIPLDNAREEPEEFSEFGAFDTFTVLNPHDIPSGASIWLYLNKNNPESRIPLYNSVGDKPFGVMDIETVADRFYLQHEEGYPGVTLHIIIGGDLRAMRVQGVDRGTVHLGEGETIGAWTHDGEGNPITSDVGRLDTRNSVLEGVDFATDAKLELVRSLLSSIDGKDFATQATLEALEGKDFATEAKLEAVRVILASLEGKDFATENTLAELAGKDFATEAKLEAVRVLLATLQGKDFATENTLSILAGKDFATEGKLEEVRATLASLEGKDFATENTLSNISNTLATILTELQAQTLLLQDIKDNTTP